MYATVNDKPCTLMRCTQMCGSPIYPPKSQDKRIVLEKWTLWDKLTKNRDKWTSACVQVDVLKALNFVPVSYDTRTKVQDIRTKTMI